MLNYYTGKNSDIDLESLKKETESFQLDLYNMYNYNEDLQVNFAYMWDQLKDRFAEAPASSKIDYHGCYIGGLMHHSLCVAKQAVRIFKILADSDNGGFQYTENDIYEVKFAGFFHDLGKIGDLTEPYYTLMKNKWQFENLGKVFKYNENRLHMSHANLSLFLLQHYGVKLSPNIYQAILGHDGQYIDANKPIAFGERYTLLAVSLADYQMAIKAKI